MWLLEKLNEWLAQYNCSLSEVILLVLTTSHPSRTASLLLEDLLLSSHKILAGFSQHTAPRNVLSRNAESLYREEICRLAHKDMGWPFSALHAHPDQIEGFHLEEMAAKMEKEAPCRKIGCRTARAARGSRRRDHQK